ncbi:hypothetical protein EDB19DRAFT_1910132 [Suillus lakei]|nr:hypothetical protein EDB19DRAFT_1910132 [Suillus lakei]
MTVVSNDPNMWPLIIFHRIFSYFTVAALTAVLYDWVLTFGQEFDLVWRKRWSFMTVLYISVRYTGIIYCVIAVLLTGFSGTTLYLVQWWIPVVINAMLGVVMIVRLNAMYQRSRKVFTFLVVAFLAKTVPCGVISAMDSGDISGEELVLSSIHLCSYEGANPLMRAENWILITVWEVLTLCLAIWIAARHFRELQYPSTGSVVGDCFTVLIKTHVLYFAAFTAVSAFNLSFLSQSISESTSVGAEMYLGILRVFSFVQMFVLGPRLIIGVREYHATVVANSDEGTGITTIVFQEHIHMLSGGDVYHPFTIASSLGFPPSPWYHGLSLYLRGSALDITANSRPRAASVPPSLLSPSANKNTTQCRMTKLGKQCSRELPSTRYLSCIAISTVTRCFMRKPDFMSDGKAWQIYLWNLASDYIPQYLQRDTQLALRVEMEKAASTSDVPGYIYTYEIRDPKRPSVIQLKVGRAVNLTKRLDQWGKQCGSKVIVRGWWPGTVEDDSDDDGTNGSLLTGNIKAGEPGPLCHRVERLVHIELADLVVHTPYLDSKFPKVDNSDTSPSTSGSPKSTPAS